jgi:hypothetical protein
VYFNAHPIGAAFVSARPVCLSSGTAAPTNVGDTDAPSASPTAAPTTGNAICLAPLPVCAVGVATSVHVRVRSCAAPCPNSVTVAGAEALPGQAARMGTYMKVDGLMQGNRPVYQRVGSTVQYLFCWPGPGATIILNNWLIGPSYTSASGGVRSSEWRLGALPRPGDRLAGS